VGAGAEGGVRVETVPAAEPFCGEKETAWEEAAPADGVQKILEAPGHFAIVRRGRFQHDSQESGPFLFADDLEDRGEQNVPRREARELRMGLFDRCDEKPVKAAEHCRQRVERCACRNRDQSGAREVIVQGYDHVGGRWIRHHKPTPGAVPEVHIGSKSGPGGKRPPGFESIRLLTVLPSESSDGVVECFAGYELFGPQVILRPRTTEDLDQGTEAPRLTADDQPVDLLLCVFGRQAAVEVEGEIELLADSRPDGYPKNRFSVGLAEEPDPNPAREDVVEVNHTWCRSEKERSFADDRGATERVEQMSPRVGIDLV
jgi:hypothetical protein